MRAFLITAIAVAITAVVSFTLGMRYHTLPAGTPVTIWQTDCNVPTVPGENLEKL